jgi:hypothetical protein
LRAKYGFLARNQALKIKDQKLQIKNCFSDICTFAQLRKYENVQK